MKSWQVMVGFCVALVSCAVLVGFGKLDPAWLSAPLTGFLGWLAPAPKEASDAK